MGLIAAIEPDPLPITDWTIPLLLVLGLVLVLSLWVGGKKV